MKTMLFPLKNGLPWLLVGVLTVLLWQALATEAAPLVPAQVPPATPHVISYQGLVELDGGPYSGAGYFKFAIVDSPSGDGSLNYWANDDTAGGEPDIAVELPVSNGLFNLLLGDTSLAGMRTPLDQSVFPQSATYLRVWFSTAPDGPFEALEPNQRIAGVPYALRAEYAANAAVLEVQLNEVVNRLAALETRLSTVEEQVQNNNVADLEAQLVAVEEQVANNTNNLTDVTTRLVAVEEQVQTITAADLDTRLAAVEEKLQHVTVTATDMFITGANLHIRNGTDSTNGTGNGRGNLIIGYNEDTGPANNRTGSHNLVVGIEHTYSSFGGLVIGHTNTISGPFASVSGGRNNRSTGFATSVSGGGGPNTADGNLASGNYAGVSGGTLNEATGIQAWVGGGRDNTAGGTESAISGGAVNIAAGRQTSITGGQRNTTNGLATTISGGVSNTTSGEGTVVSGGSSNTASGTAATVSGGVNRTAPGPGNWVGGGLVQNN